MENMHENSKHNTSASGERTHIIKQRTLKLSYSNPYIYNNKSHTECNNKLCNTHTQTNG